MALSAVMACVVMALIVDCERGQAISGRLQGILVVQCVWLGHSVDCYLLSSTLQSV